MQLTKTEIQTVKDLIKKLQRVTIDSHELEDVIYTIQLSSRKLEDKLPKR